MKNIYNTVFEDGIGAVDNNGDGWDVGCDCCDRLFGWVPVRAELPKKLLLCETCGPEGCTDERLEEAAGYGDGIAQAEIVDRRKQAILKQQAMAYDKYDGMVPVEDFDRGESGKAYINGKYVEQFITIKGDGIGVKASRVEWDQSLDDYAELSSMHGFNNAESAWLEAVKWALEEKLPAIRR